ncbi:hypothetical protein N7535_003761 [Penicillium sp. DV-2018c]|nr:hypothetical protein N7461_000540 [Penicillium sp. DV-2018c]KAJ5576835.1 hypothetical protein N7535_003761 [Penicillium sp. DV-2018c]
MAGRAPHGTYEQERRHFLTTLHAQIDILRDNRPGNRQHAIHSLELLLHRVRGLRMAGQAHFAHDNPEWTRKCNNLHGQIVAFRDYLMQDPKNTRRVANAIESMLVFADFFINDNMKFRILCEESQGMRTRDEDPRRGDRSGAPSPEPRR